MRLAELMVAWMWRVGVCSTEALAFIRELLPDRRDRYGQPAQKPTKLDALDGLPQIWLRYVLLRNDRVQG